MKKFSVLTLLAVMILSLAMVFTACSSSSDDGGGGGSEQEFIPLSFDGPWDGIIQPWGSNAPTIDGNEVTIAASSSTGFFIKYADIGYTYNPNDVLTFTYKVEIVTPKAALSVKNPKDWSGNLNGVGGADWGKGKGCEYVLGDAELSNYDGPFVRGTWDGAVGTFEVQMKLLKGSDSIGFQHNYWCDMGSPGTPIAEGSEYTVTILKIENGVSELEPEEPELTPEQQEAAFDAAVGIKELTQSSSGNNIEIDTETGVISKGDVDGWGSWVSVAIPAASLATPIIASDTIKITYIGIGNANIIIKKSNSTTDFNSQNQYQTLLGDGTVRILEIPAVRYGADIPTAVWTFQGNNSAKNWKVKIINIEVVHGNAIKITLPVSGIRPVTGATPVGNVDSLQYTGAITWEAGNTNLVGNFAGNTVYTATIVLTKKTGYTFEGVAANSIEVIGTENVVHSAGGTGTLTITATFPATQAPAPDKTITFTANELAAATAVGGTITAVTANGFTFTGDGSAQYGGAYGYIEVTFAEGYTLGSYSKIDFTFKGVSGDVNNKNARVWAFAAAPTGGLTDNADNGRLGSSAGNGNDGTQAKSDTITFTVGSAADKNKVYITFNLWAGAKGTVGGADSPTAFTISDIKFHN